MYYIRINMLFRDVLLTTIILVKLKTGDFLFIVPIKVIKYFK